jgi:hypothetical protein
MTDLCGNNGWRRRRTDGTVPSSEGWTVVVMRKGPGRIVAIACVTVVSASAARGQSQLVELRNGPVALNVTQPASGPSDVSSGASLNVALDDASMAAQAKASVGRDQNGSDFWRKQDAGFQATWSGLPGANISLAGTDQFAFIYRAPASLGDPGTATHLVRSESRTAKAAVSFSAFKNAKIEVGTDGAEAATRDDTVAQRSAAAPVHTDTQETFVRFDWTPTAWLEIETGAAARATDIVLQTQDTHSGTYRSLDPHLQVMVTPWEGAKWTATAGHVVQPYDAAAFVAYANAAQAQGATGFEPDHSWQYSARFQQAVGPASLSAGYAASRHGTATEFAAVNGVQAPAPTQLLQRDDVDLTLNLPLADFGMPDTSLTSNADWQASRVIDPVTGDIRAASGEVPRKYSVRLVHNLPASHLSLGLTGQLDGAHTSYQVSELSSTPASGSVGAFLAYSPGPYEVDLNVDGLGSSAATNYVFDGTRSSPLVSHVDQLPSPGPIIALSLHKAL